MTQNISDFECKISAEKQTIPIGETPDIKVEIKYLGNEDVYLIGALDASGIKMRFPHCYFTIEKPTPDTVSNVSRCMNMNTLRLEDFIKLRHNSSFDPYMKIDDYGFFSSYEISRKENFRIPGTYKIKFHYSTRSDNFEDYFGEDFNNIDKKELLELYAKVPNIELASNVLEITVVE